MWRTPHEREPGAKRSRGAERAVWLLPALLVVLPGLRTLPFGFTYDDSWAVLGARRLSDLATFRRPLKTLSFLIDRALFGESAAGYHLHSVLWGALAAALVALLVRRLSGSEPLGLVSGLIFAIHPVHVEAVANIASRKDLIATTFGVAAVLVTLGKEGRFDLVRAGPLRIMAAGLLMLASFLSKEVVAAGVGLFLVVWILGRPSGEMPSTRDLRLPLLAAALVAGLVLAWQYFPDPAEIFTPTHLAVLSEERVSGIGSWAQHGLAGISGSLRLLVLPFGLSADHPLPADGWPLVSRAVAGIFLLAGGISFGVMQRTRRPLAAIGVLWTALTLLPVSNILPLSTFFIAERYLYAPSVGIALIGAALFHRGWRWAASRRRQVAVAVALSAVILAGLVLTVQRMEVWRDNESLWLATTGDNPESFRAHNNLAKIHLDRADFGRAVPLYEIALPLASSRARRTVVCDLGAARLGMKQFEPAAGLLEEGVRTNPDSPACRFNLGIAVMETGDAERGLDLMEQAAAAAPGLRSLEINLLRAYRRLNRACRATDLCADVLATETSYPDDVVRLCHVVRSRCR